MNNTCRTLLHLQKLSRKQVQRNYSSFFYSKKRNVKAVGVTPAPRYYCCDHQHVVKSPFGEIDIPDLKLHEVIWRDLGQWEDKIAVECGITGRNYTYGEMRSMSKTIAASLQNQFGLKKGDCFAAVLPNLPEYPLLLLACSEAGLIVTTVNPLYTPDEMAKQFNDANVKLIFTVPEIFGNVSAAANICKKKLPIVAIKTNQNSAVPSGGINFSELTDKSRSGDLHTVDFPTSDTVVLPYSSGTTGLPKGVELMHRNLVANIIQIDHPGVRLIRPTTRDYQGSVLALLPMFHIYGMNVVLFSALKAGGKIVSLPKFEPTLLLDTLVNKKITVAYVVPPLLLFLANHPMVKEEHLKPIEYILTGAAPCGFADIEKVKAKNKNVEIGQGYGMTETSPCVLIAVKERYYKYASTGVPVPSTQAKIVDVVTKQTQPAGVVGELCVSGPQARVTVYGTHDTESAKFICDFSGVMKGYLNQPEANKEIFDHHGWLRTGDLGYYDEEGDFYIVDRLKELIKVKGFQVAPAELEEILRSHPKIIDAAVIGVKDSESGEIPKAFVVTKPGITANEDEIKEFVEGKVTKYKRLKGGVVFLDSIPKSAAGKILRKELKAKYDN